MIYQVLFYGGITGTIVCLVIAIIIFIKLNIGKVISDLTGISVKDNTDRKSKSYEDKKSYLDAQTKILAPKTKTLKRQSAMGLKEKKLAKEEMVVSLADVKESQRLHDDTRLLERPDIKNHFEEKPNIIPNLNRLNSNNEDEIKDEILEQLSDDKGQTELLYIDNEVASILTNDKAHQDVLNSYTGNANKDIFKVMEYVIVVHTQENIM